MPNTLTKEEKKVLTDETHAANERIHALVVKIISWKTGLLEGAKIQADDKITADEWKRYSKHLLTISKVQSESVVKQKLQDVYNAIKKNGGFEKGV